MPKKSTSTSDLLFGKKPLPYNPEKVRRAKRYSKNIEVKKEDKNMFRSGITWGYPHYNKMSLSVDVPTSCNGCVFCSMRGAHESTCNLSNGHMLDGVGEVRNPILHYKECPLVAMYKTMSDLAEKCEQDYSLYENPNPLRESQVTILPYYPSKFSAFEVRHEIIPNAFPEDTGVQEC